MKHILGTIEKKSWETEIEGWSGNTNYSTMVWYDWECEEIIVFSDD